MTYHNQRTFAEKINPAELERLIHYMPTIAQRSENEWARGFAQSIVRQSRRRAWRPSPKQMSMMKKLVTDLFSHGYEGGDFDLIES